MRPRIRTLKPEMWEDEKIVALSRDARLLLIGLITMADDEGRFRARRSGIVGHCLQGDDDAPRRVDGWIKEIQAQGIVVFYVVDQTPYGAFRHWRRHQKINRPSPSDLPPPPDHDVVRENGRNDHGAVTESSVSEQGGLTTSRVGARSDPDPVLILGACERLAGHIVRNDAKADPKPASERWLTDMRLLVEDRGGDIFEVERVIDWCQTDPFWRSNVLSPGKLRKQFTQLVLKADANVVPMRGRIQRTQCDNPYEPVNRLNYAARRAQAEGRPDEASRLSAEARALRDQIRAGEAERTGGAA